MIEVRCKLPNVEISSNSEYLQTDQIYIEVDIRKKNEDSSNIKSIAFVIPDNVKCVELRTYHNDWYLIEIKPIRGWLRVQGYGFRHSTEVSVEGRKISVK